MQIRGAPYLAEHNYSSLKGDSFMAAEKLRAHEVGYLPTRRGFIFALGASSL
jgi:hypothetical protein